MKQGLILIFLGILFAASGFVSSIYVDSNFVTLYPGEPGDIHIEVGNNEDFDIEDVSFQIVLDNIPFTSVGSSEKDLNDIDEDDDEDTTVTLRPSTDISPGDYEIPYKVKYYSEDDSETLLEKTGSFGLRVSAKTELKFDAYSTDNAIVSESGEVTFEIVNIGLGEIKSVYVEVFPEGYELLSNNKVFVGTVDSDDTEIANFDVVYKSNNPVFKANVKYKDFDNNDQSELVVIPFKVYTQEEAKNLGISSSSNVGIYVGVVILLIILWLIFRSFRKRKKRKK